jgi:hypothetical protein
MEAVELAQFSPPTPRTVVVFIGCGTLLAAAVSSCIAAVYGQSTVSPSEYGDLRHGDQWRSRPIANIITDIITDIIATHPTMNTVLPIPTLPVRISTAAISKSGAMQASIIQR